MKLPISGSVLQNRVVQTISIAELFRLMGRSGVWVFIPLYLLHLRNVSYIEIGILFVFSAATSIPVSIFGGNLIDKFGRRKVALSLPPMMVILFFTMFVGIHYSLSIVYIYISFVLFAPVAILQSIVDQVIITDTTTEVDRIDAFSMTRIGANVGFSLGPAISGFAVSFNYAILPLVPLIAETFGFFLYFKYITYNEGPPITKKNLLSFPHNDRRFLIISLLVSLAFFSMGPWAYILPQFFSNVYFIPYSTIGLLFAANGLAVVFLQLPVNSLLYKMDDMTRISLGLIIYAVTFAVFGLTRNVILLLVDVIVLTVGENVVSPPSNSIIGKIAPEDRRGEYYGGFSLLSGFVYPFSPIVYEALLSVFIKSPIILWGIVGTACLTLGLSFRSLRRFWKF